jgi:hypothetical protein
MRARPPHELPQRLDGGLNGGQRLGRERAEASGQPRRPPLAQRLKHARARLGDGDAHAAPVVWIVAPPLDEAGLFQLINVAHQRRRSDMLATRQRPDADARRGRDGREDAGPHRRHAQFVRLAAHVAVDAQQHGPQPVGDGERIERVLFRGRRGYRGHTQVLAPTAARHAC